MMRRSGVFALAAGLAVALSLVGCAGQAQPAGQVEDGGSEVREAVEGVGEGDGQNPVMNVVGTYACDRATITVMPKGTTDAEVSIQWGSSAFAGSEWTMSGTFDSETRTVSYANGTRVDYEYQEDDTREDSVVYTVRLPNAIPHNVRLDFSST